MYYDDNFGEWEDDYDDYDDDGRFMRQVQDESVDKICEGCGRMVHIRESYAYCNSCMVEMGHP